MIKCDVTIDLDETVKEFGIGVPDDKKVTNLHPFVSEGKFGSNKFNINGKTSSLSVHQKSTEQAAGIAITDKKCFERIQRYFANVAFIQTLIFNIKSESSVIGVVKLV